MTVDHKQDLDSFAKEHFNDKSKEYVAKVWYLLNVYRKNLLYDIEHSKDSPLEDELYEDLRLCDEKIDFLNGYLAILYVELNFPAYLII